VHSYGCVGPAEGFLQGLRALCTKYGSVLVFDEVKTGFRADLGGYQAVCGVTPDLTAFAKAIANGYPLAGLAGRESLLDSVGSDVGAAFLGTYNAWPPALAAGQVTMEILRDEALTRIATLGERLRIGLHSLIERHGVPACVVGFGSEWALYFRSSPPSNFREAIDSDTGMARRYQQGMMAGGILEPVFPLADRRLCAATSEGDIELTLEVADRVLGSLG
jgi:glutamate-1-semialdehyde 2,1-aminomutase